MLTILQLLRALITLSTTCCKVVCKTWAGLNGLGSILGWAGLEFGLGWARFLGLGSVDNRGLSGEKSMEVRF